MCSNNFGLIKIDLSGNARFRLSKNWPKWTILAFLMNFLSTQNVNVGRFLRNFLWDFLLWFSNTVRLEFIYFSGKNEKHAVDDIKIRIPKCPINQCSSLRSHIYQVPFYLLCNTFIFQNLRKRSIVRVSDVCCKNSCTMHQLREFCD